jgi:hypothetical protein
MSFWGIRAGAGRRLRPPLRRSAAMLKCELMGAMMAEAGRGLAHAFHGGVIFDVSRSFTLLPLSSMHACTHIMHGHMHTGITFYVYPRST